MFSKGQSDNVCTHFRRGLVARAPDCYLAALGVTLFFRELSIFSMYFWSQNSVDSLFVLNLAFNISKKFTKCRLCLKTEKENRAGNFKQSMGARNRVGKGLLYRPSRLHRLAELISWNKFLGSLRV